MTKLVVVSSPGEVDDLTSTSDSTFVTSDLATMWCLRQRAIEFVDVWDFVDDGDLDALSLMAAELAPGWWETPGGADRWRGVSLIEAARAEMLYVIEAGLVATRAWDRLLATVQPFVVRGDFGPGAPVTRNTPPPLAPAMAAISRQVLAWLTASRGIRCEDVGGSPAALVRRRRPRGLRAALTAPPPRLGGDIIVLLDNGMAVSDLDLLVGTLSSSGRAHVRFAEFDDRGSAGRAAADEAGHIVARARLGAPGTETARRDHPALFDNPRLAYQYAAVWTEIESAIANALAFERVLRAPGIATVVLGHDSFVRERLLEAVAAHAGVPVVSYAHSGLAPPFQFRNITGRADRILVWGTQEAGLLTRFGVGEDRIAIIGRRRPKAMPPLPRARPTVVFLTAAVNFDLAAAVSRPSPHLETWDQLVSLASRRDDLDFVLKPHPSYDHFELYEAVANGGIRIERTATLPEVLPRTSVAVLVNYTTTAAVDAMAAGVPVLYLRTAVLDTPDRRDALAGTPCEVASVAALEVAIDRLVDDVEFLVTTLAWQRQFVDSMFGPEEWSPEQRALSEIDRASAPMARGAESDRPPLLHAALSAQMPQWLGETSAERQLVVEAVLRRQRGIGRLARAIVRTLAASPRSLLAPATWRAALLADTALRGVAIRATTMSVPEGVRRRVAPRDRTQRHGRRGS